MAFPLVLTPADARRALVRYHFEPCADLRTAFNRLGSVQFDPISPAGCNHDLVLQSRVAGYRIGDWEPQAYADRFLYDGWDKQASLVPFSGYSWRRFFYHWARPSHEGILSEYAAETKAILHELRDRGPLKPKDFAVQGHRPDWVGSWYGPGIAKQLLRALWHCGEIMTSARQKGQHLYDLAERVVPSEVFTAPMLTEEEAKRELVLARHQAVGLVRPSAPYEVWSYRFYAEPRAKIIRELAADSAIVPVEVDGMRVHASPRLIETLDLPELPRCVHFLAPLDQLMWDRRLVQHIFGFEYIWEIYTPEAKRRWGYYVLPVLWGNELVARIEFWARNGVLEIRAWHEETSPLPTAFWDDFEDALRRFMSYCHAKELKLAQLVKKPLKHLSKFKAN